MKPVSQAVSTRTHRGAQKPTAGYHERLRVPLRWWVLSAAFAATLWLAFEVSIPYAAVLWGATAVVVGALAALLVGYGAAEVAVRDGELRAGRARIPVDLLAEPTVLDAEATRRQTGTEADARAYLLLRPYVRRSVRVTVTDRSDPTPYWLLSTRHPERLVASLRRAGAA
jgi:hypothetical protein